MDFQFILDHDMDNQEWEERADGFADYSLYQTPAYQAVRGAVDKQEISRIVVNDESGEVALMCHLRIKHVKMLGLRIGYVQWGPMIRTKGNKMTCSVEALASLRRVYMESRVNVLRIVPNVYADPLGESVAHMFREAGFESIRHIPPYRTIIIPLGNTEEGIRKKLRKSFRRDLKKAENTELEIREDKSMNSWNTLERLYLDLLKRKKFKGLDPSVFTKTQSRLSASEKMNIITTYLDNESVGVHLTSQLGDKAIVLLAASNEKGLVSGSSYLMWYQGAVSAMRAGMKRYDLGGIDPEENPTVYKFKSRMGGEEICSIGAFEAYSSPWVKNVWRAAERSYRLIRK